jgi:hypothetical protein
MEEKMPAHWVRLACDFDGALAIISTLVDCSCALTAIEAGLKSNSLELLEEMAVRFIVLVDENPSRVWCVLSALFKQGHEACRNGDGSLFVILWSKANVLFLPDVKFHPFEINIGPASELNFLFAAGGPEKELVADCVFVGHHAEQFFQLLVSKRNWWIFLECREILGERKAGLNPMFFEQGKNRHDSIV